MDLPKSHLFNYDFMKMMRDNNVEVCGFPPHCTHLLQPLDDIPFARFKTEWQKELMALNWYLQVWSQDVQAAILQVFYPCIPGRPDCRCNKERIPELWNLPL